MQTRSRNMANILDMQKTLEEIKVQLATKATNDKIDELLKEIREKDKKIESLEARIEALEGKIEVQSKVNSLLERKVDDGEQYQRRLSLRIVT